MNPALAERAERWRAPVQAGAAAGMSWWVASIITHHAAPLSAPVVAVIAIGATTGGRARRTVDVIFGLTIGIALASALVSAFGRTAPLLAIVVVAAMLAARATRDGEVLMTQAGIAAILVFATPHEGTTSAAFARIADALIGGASAAVVSLFVLPPDPVWLLTARLRSLHAEMAAVLQDVASGLERNDPHHLAATLQRARATDDLVDALHTSRPVAAEIARFVPARRSQRDNVARLDSAAIAIDFAIRNTRVIARAALSLLSAEEVVRCESALAIATLVEAVRQLDAHQSDERGVHARASQAADRLAAIHGRRPIPALGAIAAASRGIADDLASAPPTASRSFGTRSARRAKTVTKSRKMRKNFGSSR